MIQSKPTVDSFRRTKRCSGGYGLFQVDGFSIFGYRRVSESVNEPVTSFQTSTRNRKHKTYREVVNSGLAIIVSISPCSQRQFDVNLLTFTLFPLFQKRWKPNALTTTYTFSTACRRSLLSSLLCYQYVFIKTSRNKDTSSKHVCFVRFVNRL